MAGCFSVLLILSFLLFIFTSFPSFKIINNNYMNENNQFPATGVYLTVRCGRLLCGLLLIGFLLLK